MSKSCQNMSHLKKYAERSGPPYPAGPCEGLIMFGNDNKSYISERRGKAKVARWFKLDGEKSSHTKTKKSPKKSSKKSVKKSVKKSTKKRCPTGKKRNSKTGRCIKK